MRVEFFPLRQSYFTESFKPLSKLLDRKIVAIATLILAIVLGCYAYRRFQVKKNEITSETENEIREIQERAISHSSTSRNPFTIEPSGPHPIPKYVPDEIKSLFPEFFETFSCSGGTHFLKDDKKLWILDPKNVFLTILDSEKITHNHVPMPTRLIDIMSKNMQEDLIVIHNKLIVLKRKVDGSCQLECYQFKEETLPAEKTNELLNLLWKTDVGNLDKVDFLRLSIGAYTEFSLVFKKQNKYQNMTFDSLKGKEIILFNRNAEIDEAKLQCTFKDKREYSDINVIITDLPKKEFMVMYEPSTTVICLAFFQIDNQTALYFQKDIPYCSNRTILSLKHFEKFSFSPEDALSSKGLWVIDRQKKSFNLFKYSNTLEQFKIPAPVGLESFFTNRGANHQLVILDNRLIELQINEREAFLVCYELNEESFREEDTLENYQNLWKQIWTTRIDLPSTSVKLTTKEDSTHQFILRDLDSDEDICYNVLNGEKVA